MKLLSKTEVILKSNDQKKSDIDSGIYIAGRIDKLRETLVQLEQQQKDFIDGNKKTIREALDAMFDEKHALQIELKSLQDKRTELLEPLDAKWDEVNSVSDEVNALKEKITKQAAEYEEKTIKSQELLKNAKEEMHRCTVANETAQKLLTEIAQKHQETLEKFDDVQRFIEKTNSDFGERERMLATNERKLEFDRKHYLDFESNIREREKEVALREKRLAIRELKSKI